MATLKDLRDTEKRRERALREDRNLVDRIAYRVDQLHYSMIKKDKHGQPEDKELAADLYSLTAYYDHRVSQKEGKCLDNNDHFITCERCLFCGHVGEITHKVKSFRENKIKCTYMFKVCKKCGKWEKLPSSRMVKGENYQTHKDITVPIISKKESPIQVQKTPASNKKNGKKSKSKTSTPSSGKKLQKFSIEDVKKLRAMLNSSG